MCTLVGLTNLQELSLDNTVVTDDGIKYIANLHNLVYLSLSDTKYVGYVYVYSVYSICMYILTATTACLVYASYWIQHVSVCMS